MSKKVFSSPAADNQKEILDSLIDSKKGKGGANQHEAKQFKDTWVAYAKTVGINDETIAMLYGGFCFAAGEPLYIYANETHSTKAYTSFFGARATKANEQGIALKVALNLFALELGTPTSNESTRIVARAIPRLSKNKDGKAFGTLERSIRGILIKPLARKKIDDSIQIETGDASAILALLSGSLERFAQKSKIQSVETGTALRLLAWLKNQAGIGKAKTTEAEMTPSATDESLRDKSSMVVSESAEGSTAVSEESAHTSKGEFSNIPVQKASITTTPLVSESTPISSNVPTSGIERNIGGTLDMDSVLKFLAGYQDEYEKLAQDNERLRRAKEDYKARASQTEQDLRKAQREIDGHKERVASLSEHNSSLQERLNSALDDKETLESKLSAAEEMLSMIEQRNTRQADESTRRLASKLRIEYQDYQDAADLPMSEDLGENMREQLKNVFDILIAGGLDL